jgi:hypothetical protein
VSTMTFAPSRRDLALLRAVAAGRAELVCGCQPDLLIEGRWCCDQPAAHQLAAAGLLSPAIPAPVGSRVPAVLTETGHAVLVESPCRLSAESRPLGSRASRADEPRNGEVRP